MSDDRYGEIRRRELDDPLTASEAWDIAFKEALARKRTRNEHARQAAETLTWYANYLKRVKPDA